MADDITAGTPGAARDRSARLLLRLPQGLHRALQGSARASGLSLNEYCIRRLAAPAPSLGVDDDAVRVVSRAGELFGEHLVAVVVYGSWPTGQAADSSDVDVLVVLERAVPLTRALYRRWDEQPLRWRGRQVDPHFTHVPGNREIRSGLWAEVALSAIPLYERDERVGRHLLHVRAEIAAGRLVRRVVHGQPYWTEAA